MDVPEPKRLPHNYYNNIYLKDSRAAFLSAIKEKCSDKEDQTACVEKYTAAFNSVFDHLKGRLEEECRVTYYFDKRMKNNEGIWAEMMTRPYRTGYEKI
jgi:hypothetical protein